MKKEGKGESEERLSDEKYNNNKKINKINK